MSKEINPKTRAIADAIKPILSYESTTGQGSSEEFEKVTNAFLPPELTVEGLHLAEDHLIDVAAAHALAAGEVSLDLLKANPDLKSTSLKSKIGHFGYETTVERERSGVAMGKPWKKQGIVNTDVIVGQGRRRSDYKAVVEYIGNTAESVFSN